VLLDLPGRSSRYLVDDLELLGQVVGRKSARFQPGDHRGEVELRRTFEHDARARALAEPRIGQADHSGRADLGEPDEEVFDLTRRDVQAAPNDDFLPPTDNREIAVGILDEEIRLDPMPGP
jgi:hypothetical protein